MARFLKLSSMSCMVAALSMAATPALAADFPQARHPGAVTSAPVQHWDNNSVNAQRHRHWHHRDRVDAGDVLAGVLIIGGIAAIANAASRPRTERRYPDNDARYRQPVNARSSNSGNGLDRAVDMCVNEIERDVRVDTVDGASRTGSGWTVTGTLYNGDGFSCQIDNRGRISDISYGDQVAASFDGQSDRQPDRQWDDARYRQAWQQVESGAENRTDGDPEPYEYAQVDPQPTGPQPAYPGGPIDGDLPEEDGFGG